MIVIIAVTIVIIAMLFMIKGIVMIGSMIMSMIVLVIAKKVNFVMIIRAAQTP